jgi:type I restriction enzyme S subunit
MPDETKATSKFIYYYLAYARSRLEEIAPQSAQKNINLRILNPLPISLPPCAEQCRIVAYLDDLQAKIDGEQIKWTKHNCFSSYQPRMRPFCSIY